jgi:heme A synthase
MSALSIAYQSDPETSIGVFKPLADALGDFGRTSAYSLAEAVRFVARGWPFFILALIVLGVVRIWLRGRRRKA